MGVRNKLKKMGTTHCTYCGREFTTKNPATSEHRTPRVRQKFVITAQELDDYFCPTCRQCNHIKSDMTEAEYLYFLKHKRYHPAYVTYCAEIGRDIQKMCMPVRVAAKINKYRRLFEAYALKDPL